MYIYICGDWVWGSVLRFLCAFSPQILKSPSKHYNPANIFWSKVGQNKNAFPIPPSMRKFCLLSFFFSVFYVFFLFWGSFFAASTQGLGLYFHTHTKLSYMTCCHSGSGKATRRVRWSCKEGAPIKQLNCTLSTQPMQLNIELTNMRVALHNFQEASSHKRAARERRSLTKLCKLKGTLLACLHVLASGM